MLRSGILLLIFGTYVTSAHVLKNGMPCKHAHAPFQSAVAPIPFTAPKFIDHLPAYQPLSISSVTPQFLSHFVQQGTNLFYKPDELPKIVMEAPRRISKAPATNLPKPVEEVIEFKPLTIPRAPELSPFVTPKLPATVVYEESAPPVSLPMIPEAPIVQIQEYIKPLNFPHAPVLPPVRLPELPVKVKYTPYAPAIPAVREVVPVPEFKPINIPRAPELQQITLPELLPSVHVDTIPVAPVRIPEVYRPVNIPKAPEIPTFVMPEIPAVLVEEEKSSVPCFHDIIVPSGPKFKPMPEIPYKIQKIVETKPIMNPPTPELPPFEMPKIPATVIREELLPTPLGPIQIDSDEPCVDVEIVKVKPTMTINAFPMFRGYSPFALSNFYEHVEGTSYQKFKN